MEVKDIRFQALKGSGVMAPEDFVYTIARVYSGLFNANKLLKVRNNGLNFQGSYTITTYETYFYVSDGTWQCQQNYGDPVSTPELMVV